LRLKQGVCMNNRNRLFGIAAILAAVVFSMTALSLTGCDDGSTGGKDTAATPTASPGVGAVVSSTPITLACTTVGADIYYTLDGSTPSTSSAKYNVPIFITPPLTIKAIAVKAGMNNSGILSAAYTLAGGPSPLTGTVAISGTAMVGFTLTADITNLGGSGTISYQWKRSNGTAIGTNQNTYLVVEGDIGSTITVSVTRAGMSGEVTSTPTGTVILQPNYGITLDPSVDKTFAAAIVGSPVEPYTVSVQNIGKQLTGALSIALTGDSSNFELSGAIISSIAVGESATFTVTPKNPSGTVVKKYQAIVEVSNVNISTNIIVDFTPFLATVSFDSTGGDSVASYTNREYGTVTKPADPTKSDGRIFDRWYKEAALTNEWNFASDHVTENTTLYAKWSYIVTFDSDGGSPAPSAITTLKDGETIGIGNKPSDPTKTMVEGLYAGKHTDPNPEYTFDGWFAPGASAAFNFNTPIIADTTLTAKWTSSLPDPINIASQAGTYIVDKAVAYVKANAAADKEYTLYIADDYSFYTFEITTANFKLTIIGLGSERKLGMLSSNGLFMFDAQDGGCELTIGNNITLVGRATSSSRAVVNMFYNNTFTMLEGSKITDHLNNMNGGGVVVQNGGIFIMYGGVYAYNATFHMVNGTIYGSNETDPALRNTSALGANSNSSCDYGTFSGPDGAWVSNGTLTDSNNTIRVVDGVLQPSKFGSVPDWFGYTTGGGARNEEFLPRRTRRRFSYDNSVVLRGENFIGMRGGKIFYHGVVLTVGQLGE
jgi:uncharacterized repeat protein (TIGR02543 family)